jgi:hypothetical protein
MVPWYRMVPSVWYRLFYHRQIRVNGRFLKISIAVKLVISYISGHESNMCTPSDPYSSLVRMYLSLKICLAASVLEKSNMDWREYIFWN